jgi:hypothetical protein
MTLLDKRCEHIKNNTPIVLRRPWYKIAKERTYAIKHKDNQTCSICNSDCLFEGDSHDK